MHLFEEENELIAIDRIHKFAKIAEAMGLDIRTNKTMAHLAIKGHPERGKEVIEILEMMEGYNANNCSGKYCDRAYYINENGYIDQDFISHVERNTKFIIFSLEEFLEKFPYKVGDKVQYKGATSCGSIFEVEEMRWEENTVKYTLCLFGCNYKRSTLPAEYLQPYEEENYCQIIGIGNYTSSNGIITSASLINEETMKEKENSIVVNIEHKQLKVHSLRFDKTQLVMNDEYELKQEGDAYYIVRKKIQSPKTYIECAKILESSSTVYIDGYKVELLEKFQKLLICRDAYWKIAGEQMGLGKPWKPDWNDCAQHRFGLYTLENEIRCINLQMLRNIILVFPTEEMRDAFYENFKDLIEIVMRKIIKWVKNLFWWRFYYIKTRITTQEANRGRCLICHAGIRVNPNDTSQPICSDYSCPCKWNERLIIR